MVGERMMYEHFAELWRFRALVGALVVRQLATRYRGSALGFLWSFLNPLGLMLVYLLVFQYYMRFQQVENYTIFLFCGLLPWIWFTSAIHEGTASIVSSGHLVTKAMFPAHVLPTVAVLTTLANFLLSLPLLGLFMIILGVSFHSTLLLLPVIILVQGLFILGLVLLLSSLNVHYRDVQHVVGNVLTLLFFLCPIIYPEQSVPQAFQFTMDYNPVAQFSIAYHRIILDGVWPGLWTSAALALSSLVMLVLGILTFRRYREGFAELL